MTWDHLSINKPHLVYIILGGFTSLFMLCSSFIKERLYIGEATVATICGIIFGPHALNLINPMTWGNTDQVTLEFSRIVLVVQCFAVGVELPKYYVEKHWRSVLFLLIPVMTCGWMATSLIIWWMIPTLNWLESLCVAACVTATDPVLASSVVGKGKFARRVPKHLRDLLSAESGANDGMAFPFIYLALYLIEDRPNANKVAYSWFLLTILYECVFGCIYGFVVGYIGRHGIKFAAKHELVDKESFLVFYFVLALFCAGSGSIMGVDDLLVGFSAGVGFSNDGWFQKKTEESQVSDVIDLLLNLAYFVYLGTIIPWEQYNNPAYGITPWRLVIIAIFVILFRRIPAMMAFKPMVPDIKTWREALFAGHFGPIGVGAIFVAILARAELESGSPTPLENIDPNGPNHKLVWLIWPITTFLVISSILVHGSSIAVFTLGKRINTFALTMSYTTANEDGPGWVNRLPKISSISRSQAKSMNSGTTENDLKMSDLPPGMLPPIGIPREFLRRQKEEDTPLHNFNPLSSRSRREKRKSMLWADDIGPGGPISRSAIFPQRDNDIHNGSLSDTVTPGIESSENEKIWHKTTDDNLGGYPDASIGQSRSDSEETCGKVEVFDEGGKIIIENQDGDVQKAQITYDREEKSPKSKVGGEGDDAELSPRAVKSPKEVPSPKGPTNNMDQEALKAKAKSKAKPQGTARAYQFGNTIILEDEDGEVLKTYELPSSKPKTSNEPDPTLFKSRRVATWANMRASGSQTKAEKHNQVMNRWGLVRKKILERSTEVIKEEDDDKRLRFVIDGKDGRLTKEELIKQLQGLDPRTRVDVVREGDESQTVEELTNRVLDSNSLRKDSKAGVSSPQVIDQENNGSRLGVESKSSGKARIERSPDRIDENIYLNQAKQKNTFRSNEILETEAERKRREGALKGVDNVTLDERGRAQLIIESQVAGKNNGDKLGSNRGDQKKTGYEDETAVEKRRRELALGIVGPGAENPQSSRNKIPREPPPVLPRRSISFAAKQNTPRV